MGRRGTHACEGKGERTTVCNYIFDCVNLIDLRLKQSFVKHCLNSTHTVDGENFTVETFTWR